MAKLPEQLIGEEVIRELVRGAVKETIKELRRGGLLKRSDDVAYAEISERLFEYYQHPKRDTAMGEALKKIESDYYFEIVPQYYRSKVTIDWIAEGYHCEVSTITRNKKRLCLRLYSILNEN